MRKPEPPIMDAKEWLALNAEARLLRGFYYRRTYEDALAFAGVTDAPEWEDLTHAQRLAVKTAQDEYTVLSREIVHGS